MRLYANLFFAIVIAQSSVTQVFAQAGRRVAPRVSAASKLTDISNELSIKMGTGAPADSYRRLLDDVKNFAVSYRDDLEKNPALKANYAKMKKVAAIQAKFAACMKRFNVDGSIGQRIISLAMGIDADSIDCTTNNHTLEEQIRQTNTAVNAALKENLRQGMIGKAQVNAATNVTDMLYRVKDLKSVVRNESSRYRDKPWPDITGNHEQDVKALAFASVCGNGCSSSEAAKVRSAIDKQIANAKSSGAQPQSIADIRSALVSKVEHINGTLEHPNITVNSNAAKALDLDKDEYAEIDARDYYSQYVQEYFNETSTGVGLLLHTDSMTSKVGAIQAYDGVDEAKKNQFILDLDKHKTNFAATDVVNAVNEYASTMRSQGTDLRKERTATGKDAEDSLKNLVANYPLAAAQMLLEDPQYAQAVCDAANEAEDEAEASSKGRGWLRVASMITGGVLAVGGTILSFTGIGATIGVPLAIAGAAMTGIEIGLSTADYYTASQQLDQLVAGQMSGSGDRVSAQQSAQLRDQMSSAVSDIAINAGLSLTGTAGFVKGARAIGGSVKGYAQSTRMVQRLSEGARRISNDMRLRSLKNVMTEDEYGQLLARIANLDADKQAVVLEEMKRMKDAGADAADFAKVKDVIDDVNPPSCMK